MPYRNYSLLLLVFCMPATAGENTIHMKSSNQATTVIELFTSQGCSSCPPAEHWLNSFVKDERLWVEIIPLAFHVDYWDRLGWPDPFADKAYTNRQYNYRSQKAIHSVYTPGLIVNGREWRGWHLGQTLNRPKDQVGELSAEIQPNAIKARYSTDNRNLVLNAAVLGFGIETRVERGENRNKTLPHEFVVLIHQQFVSNREEWKVSLPKLQHDSARRYGLALWVSEGEQQAPIQATGGWIPTPWVVNHQQRSQK